MRTRRNQSGLTLIELIVAFTILLILTSMAVPLARAKVRTERERELHRVLKSGWSSVFSCSERSRGMITTPTKILPLLNRLAPG